jgi:hypothetical protein
MPRASAGSGIITVVAASAATVAKIASVFVMRISLTSTCADNADVFYWLQWNRLFAAVREVRCVSSEIPSPVPTVAAPGDRVLREMDRVAAIEKERPV